METKHIQFYSSFKILDKNKIKFPEKEKIIFNDLFNLNK